jgi:hypothetical protein
VKCYNCQKCGHQARDCPSDLRCWDCGGRHMSHECRLRYRQRSSDYRHAVCRVSCIYPGPSDDNVSEERVGVRLIANGTDVDFLPDTGADVTVINPSTAQRLGVKVLPATRCLSGVDGSSLAVEGETILQLGNKCGSSIRTRASVVSGAPRNLLGVSDIRALYQEASHSFTEPLQRHQSERPHSYATAVRRAATGSDASASVEAAAPASTASTAARMRNGMVGSILKLPMGQLHQLLGTTHLEQRKVDIQHDGQQEYQACVVRPECSHLEQHLGHEVREVEKTTPLRAFPGSYELLFAPRTPPALRAGSERVSKKQRVRVSERGVKGESERAVRERVMT